MEADIEFLDETKEACEDKADEWTTRKHTQSHNQGLKEASEILTSDEAWELCARPSNLVE